ncbi:hypothetical protein ACOME3_002698 [Neoechinorhynchus agilis]
MTDKKRLRNEEWDVILDRLHAVAACEFDRNRALNELRAIGRPHRRESVDIRGPKFPKSKPKTIQWDWRTSPESTPIKQNPTVFIFTAKSKQSEVPVSAEDKHQENLIEIDKLPRIKAKEIESVQKRRKLFAFDGKKLCRKFKCLR